MGNSIETFDNNNKPRTNIKINKEQQNTKSDDKQINFQPIKFINKQKINNQNEIKEKQMEIKLNKKKSNKNQINNDLENIEEKQTQNQINDMQLKNK